MGAPKARIQREREQDAKEESVEEEEEKEESRRGEEPRNHDHHHHTHVLFIFCTPHTSVGPRDGNATPLRPLQEEEKEEERTAGASPSSLVFSCWSLAVIASPNPNEETER